MKTTCTECGGTGRCIHCHGTGVLAPIFWHEGSRGPGEGLRCSRCMRGDCATCFGTGRIEAPETVEESLPSVSEPLPATEGAAETAAKESSRENEEETAFIPLFFA